MTALPAEQLKRAERHGLTRRAGPPPGWVRGGRDRALVFPMLSGRWGWRPEPADTAKPWEGEEPKLRDTEAEALAEALDWLDAQGGGRG